MGITSLSDLSPRHSTIEVTIQVQVNRKWEYKAGIDDGPILHIGLVLIDNKGNAIHAEIPADLVPEKGSLLDINKVYEISRFKVSPSKKKFRPVDAPFMIHITLYTTVKLSANPPNTFPTYVYRLIPYNQIDPFDSNKANQFHDVLGVITEVSPIKLLQLSNKPTPSNIRDILIKDLNENILRITLWGNRALEFSVASIYDSEKENPIVALFVGCLPKQFQGNIYLSGGEVCSWYFTPVIHEAEPYYDRLLSKQIALELPSSSTQHTTSDAPQNIQHKTLKDLMDMIPYHLPDEGCLCTVTITKICDDAEWWYPACPKCAVRTVTTSTGYQCPQCATIGHNLRYKLHFMARDETAEAKMFCFDGIAKQIVGKTCQSIHASITKDKQIPQDLEAIVSLKFTFGVIFNDRSFNTREKVLRIKSIKTAHGRDDTLQQIPKNIESTAPSTPIKFPPIALPPDSPSMAMSKLSTSNSPKITKVPSHTSTKDTTSKKCSQRALLHEDTSVEPKYADDKEIGTQFESPTKKPKNQDSTK